MPGDVVVFNNSRVIPARFNATDKAGNIFEITLHTSVSDKLWWGLTKKFNKLNAGDNLNLENKTEITVLDKNDDSGILVEFNCENVFAVLESVGKMPLPPYMKRDAEIDDKSRYQTVYADPLGSMAAPTAGLHFTPELLSEIKSRGAQIVNITLHVGAGTWLPVKTEDLSQHKMHSEWGCITADQADIINAAARVIAVGTTSLRLLESAAGSPPLEGCPQGGVVYPSSRDTINYYSLPFNSNLKEHAKELRKAGSLPEALFWNEIKAKKINGLDFDRQKIIGNYIVDFYCASARTVIEIDDKATHDNKVEYDKIRDEYLQSLGLNIIHVSANEVLKKIDYIIKMLVNHPALQAPLHRRGTVQPFCTTTNIFITPGYRFRVVDALLTNFHLPKSTLFMLVCAFAGTNEIKSAYAHAVEQKYRFFSYGDCCLLFKNKEN